jgi:hypothetical protein
VNRMPPAGSLRRTLDAFDDLASHARRIKLRVLSNEAPDGPE